MPTDQYWMMQALQLAERAKEEGEVPVGAVLVLDNKLIGAGWNQLISLSDPCAHAEILALRQGAKTLGNYRLLNTTLYVTLEPCFMCAGALIHARIKRLVYAAPDPKTGAVNSLYCVLNHAALNHQVVSLHGVLQEEASLMLKNFFKEKRACKKIETIP